MVQVGITGGSREMTETTAGEIHTTGTQLLPVGKSAEKGIRSFVWLQFETAPVYVKLTEAQVAAIKEVLAEDPRLPVENHIWYPMGHYHSAMPLPCAVCHTQRATRAASPREMRASCGLHSCVRIFNVYVRKM